MTDRRKRVIVTGASSGIGEAIAVRFAREGWDTCILARRGELLNALRDSFSQGHHLVCPGSYDDPTVIDQMSTLIDREWGEVDVLINNAGVAISGDPIASPLDAWRKPFDIMVNGAILVTRAAVPRLVDGGRVIHVTSIHGERVEKGSSAYAMAKAAINQYCRSLALELAPRRILVNAIAPGFINTPMSVSGGVSELETDWFRQNYIDGHHLPLKRAGEPEEIAGVAYFLASPDASYITGQVITVDGGLTITFDGGRTMKPIKIESVDFFYLSMPQIDDIGDGSQDALLVRVEAGGFVGWGECEASPLVTIAAFVCPMSHSACKPVIASVLGHPIDSPNDIIRMHAAVRQNSMDVLQADHALSGIDIALWDLLGKRYEQPTWKLLGYDRAYPKIPYASMLFGDTPHETLIKCQAMRERGFQVIKLGWGLFGKNGAQADADQLAAAREGLGAEARLCVDVGTVWSDDLTQAQDRLEMLKRANVLWLEEPFHTGAFKAYRSLADQCAPVQLAGGEAAHNEFMALHMIDYAGVGYIQIDTGRIGGITSAKRVADYAAACNIRFVNHTFTSHLALSASLQPYAGLRDHDLCEYPVELKSLAFELTRDHLLPDANGMIITPDQPELGLAPDVDALRKYLVDAEITVRGKTLYKTPTL